MKTICVPLTNRTNYSKLKLVLKELKKIKDIKIELVLSSTILLNRFGDGFLDIENDGWHINKKIDCVLLNDSHEAMSKTIGLSIIEHATYFASINPDILLIVGDRFDMLAPAISGSIMNIPIAHIQGGEVSGTIDNVIRDVISRQSIIHFVATEKSAINLSNTGINKNSIYNYGCPAVEYISNLDIGEYFDEQKINKNYKRKFDIKKNEKYILVMLHPDTTNKNDIDAKKILSKIANTNLKVILFYPNVDANNSLILSCISNYRNNKNFYMIRHMPLEGFIHVMAHASIMITNSSSGIREAASFGTPVINIGARQKNRERNQNTIDLDNNYDDLESLINKYKNIRYPKINIYLKENCSKLIVSKLLEKINY